MFFLLIIVTLSDVGVTAAIVPPTFPPFQSELAQIMVVYPMLSAHQQTVDIYMAPEASSEHLIFLWGGVSCCVLMQALTL